MRFLSFQFLCDRRKYKAKSVARKQSDTIMNMSVFNINISLEILLSPTLFLFFSVCSSFSVAVVCLFSQIPGNSFSVKY